MVSLVPLGNVIGVGCVNGPENLRNDQFNGSANAEPSSTDAATAAAVAAATCPSIAGLALFVDDRSMAGIRWA